MSMKSSAAQIAAQIDEATVSRAPLVAVGDVREWESAGATPLRADDIMFVDIEEVTPQLLRELQPRVVLTAVLTRRFDCIDVGQRLIDSGFRGSLRLVAGKLPRPEIVLSELRAQFPGLQVQIGDPVRPVLVN